MKRPVAITGLVLLAAGTVVTLLVVAGLLRERLFQEHAASARIVLQSVAASVARANDLGIPLDKMVGLDDLVRSRVTEDSGLISLRLLDHGNAVAWRYGKRFSATTRALEVPVGRVGKLQADFVPPSDLPALLRVAIVVIGVAIGLSIPLFELARLSDVARGGFTAQQLRRQVDSIRRGDFRITWRLSGSGADDSRLPALRDQVLLLNEQYQRVARLVGSLRRTEPDTDKRARMGALVGELRTRFRFSDQGIVFDRRIWPDVDTARCFAALALLLANLPIDASLSALTWWGLGLALGSRDMAVRWPTRMIVGLVIAALANLLIVVGTPWTDVAAHVMAGIASALAARAAMDAGRAYVRPVMASALLAGTVAGPIVGFAAVAALNSFADSRWLYFTAAGLAIVTAGWLFYRVADEEIPVARPRRARPALAPMLSGVVWSAANVAFIALNAGNRGEALWLIVAQIPGMLILANANERVRTGLAVALAVVAGVSLTRFLLPQALADWLNPTFLTWLGAFCMGGTLAAVPDCWRAPPSRALAGFSLGVLLSLALISAVAWIAVDAVRPVALTGTLAALLVLFVARRSAWGRMR